MAGDPGISPPPVRPIAGTKGDPGAPGFDGLPGQPGSPGLAGVTFYKQIEYSSESGQFLCT